MRVVEFKGPFPIVLGDTSSTFKPPPDFVEYLTEPKVISRVEPEYPKEALEYYLEANVFVKCWVTNTGDVRRAVLLQSDHRIFNKCALEAALQWKFEPAKNSAGLPVEIWVSIPFRFRMSN